MAKNFTIPTRVPANPLAGFLLLLGLLRLSSDIFNFDLLSAIVVMPTILGILYVHFIPISQRQLYIPALLFIASLLVSRLPLFLAAPSQIADILSNALSFILIFPLFYLLFSRRLKYFFLLLLIFLPFLQRDAMLALFLVSALYFMPMGDRWKLFLGRISLFALIAYPLFLYVGGRELAIFLADFSTMRSIYFYELLNFKLSSLVEIFSYSGENRVGEVLRAVTTDQEYIETNYGDLQQKLIKAEGYAQCAHNVMLDVFVKYGAFAIPMFLLLFFERSLFGLMIIIAFITVQSLQCGLDNYAYMTSFYFAFCVLRSLGTTPKPEL